MRTLEATITGIGLLILVYLLLSRDTVPVLDSIAKGATGIIKTLQART